MVRERVTLRLRARWEYNLRFKAATAAPQSWKVNDGLVDQILAAADKMAHRLHSSHQLSIMDLCWRVLEGSGQDFTPLQEAGVGCSARPSSSLTARERRRAPGGADCPTHHADAGPGRSLA